MNDVLKYMHWTLIAEKSKSTRFLVNINIKLHRFQFKQQQKLIFIESLYNNFAHYNEQLPLEQ